MSNLSVLARYNVLQVEHEQALRLEGVSQAHIDATRSSRAAGALLLIRALQGAMRDGRVGDARLLDELIDFTTGVRA